jgi:ligand-binding sensor domain-containing protein
MAMNSILCLSILISFASCNGQNQGPPENKIAQTVTINIGDTVQDIGENIGCILQDRNGSYWFASNGEGAYRYNGKAITHITDKNGLCSNFVLRIEEDVNGNLWFSTRDGICSFNGTSFTNYAFH